jgi:predicted adenine nucleotide alpha hydrolase (AANH) superfamily ATPase
MSTSNGKTALLLHVCCAPCATHCIETLVPRYHVTLLFSNSNIAPQDEYARRLEHVRKLVALHGLPLIEDAYDHAAWRAAVRGHEDEPERGARCRACFAFNLARTAAHARSLNLAQFTTTLTISPHKSTQTIFEIGRAHDGFLPVDFKQDNGFTRAAELTRKYGLYRQDYCGCEFSAR